MLDNLVESKNNSKAAAKFYGFLFSTFLVVATILVSATLWSLFAKDFVMGNDEINLSTLLTPIPVDTNEPPPESEKQKQQDQPQTNKNQPPSRRTNMARIDEVQRTPDKVSVAPNSQKARPNVVFELNPNIAESEGFYSNDNGREPLPNSKGSFTKPDTETIAVEITKTKIPTAPPALKKAEEKPKAATVTLGVVNGKAANLPKPPYPPAAKAVGASGAVNVQVLIDETGNVISAKAVTGHPLLRAAAERAARNARFTPTYLSKVPVKVNGLIVYNFTK